jgi:membrane fusion protein, heavy metal efflux system
MNARHPRGTAVATLATSALLLFTFVAVPASGHGDEEHDHGDAAAAPTGDGPRRQPDGRVFLPKLSQRQLAIRTSLVAVESLPRAVSLSGRVGYDPAAGGRVQASVTGRLEAGPKGLASLGQQVRKGEILGVVRPVQNALETASQRAAALDAQARLSAAEARLKRVEQLEGSVSLREIEQARAEVASLRAQARALSGGLGGEPLTAPVSGIVAAASGVAGEIVDARDTLFEVVDPRRMRIEAVAYDVAAVVDVAEATASARPGESIPLKFVGAGRSLREGALPVQFIVDQAAGDHGLVVGQPVQVIARSQTKVKAIRVPSTAVVKNPSNLDIVWVHTQPELFEPRVIRWQPLDGATVAIESGIAADDRVVVQGAPLLNQVR